MLMQNSLQKSVVKNLQFHVQQLNSGLSNFKVTIFRVCGITWSANTNR